jgi:signal transduction histidine kinase
MMNETIENMLQQIMNAMNQPIMVLDTDTHIVLINHKVDAIFESVPGQYIGQKISLISGMESIPVLLSGLSTSQDWVSPNQRQFVLKANVLEFGSSGVYHVISFEDVTQLRKISKNQNEFVRVLSHDLRTPLTSMQGFASMLEQEVPGELNDKQKHFVNKILSGITQMTSLLENIQDAGRFDPETGFYEMMRSHCDLVEITRHVVENCVIPPDRPPITVEFVADDTIPLIYADSLMLDRAITNLVDNAIKYMIYGGKVNVIARRVGDQIQVAIQDSGPGISAEDQKQLFQKHVRLNRSEFKKVKGTGLGLFIVRSVAVRHFGDCWVESEVGKGTTFFFSIPIDQQTESA